MSPYFHLKAKFRALLHMLVLCAVFLNVSVPAGAMLERSPDGTIKIIVCTAQGILNAWLDVETGQVALQDAGQDGTDENGTGQNDNGIPTECPMASPTVMAASDGALVIFITVRIAQPFRTEMYGVKLVIGQSPARLSARGPPISL